MLSSKLYKLRLGIAAVCAAACFLISAVAYARVIAIESHDHIEILSLPKVQKTYQLKFSGKCFGKLETLYQSKFGTQLNLRFVPAYSSRDMIYFAARFNPLGQMVTFKVDASIDNHQLITVSEGIPTIFARTVLKDRTSGELASAHRLVFNGPLLMQLKDGESIGIYSPTPRGVLPKFTLLSSFYKKKNFVLEDIESDSTDQQCLQATKEDTLAELTAFAKNVSMLWEIK